MISGGGQPFVGGAISGMVVVLGSVRRMSELQGGELRESRREKVKGDVI